MAVYHAHIAYGSASYETKVFNDILDEWTKSYIIYEVPPSKNKEDSEEVEKDDKEEETPWPVALPGKITKEGTRLQGNQSEIIQRN